MNWVSTTLVAAVDTRQVATRASGKIKDQVARSSSKIKWQDQVARSSGKIKWQDQVARSSGKIKWQDQVARSSDRSKTVFSQERKRAKLLCVVEKTS